MLDRAMREESWGVVGPRAAGAAGDGGGEGGESGEVVVTRGLLGPRVRGVIVLATKVLERGERFGT